MESAVLEKEIYIIFSRSTGGTGTKIDPLRTTNGEIDQFLPLLGNSCKLRLGAGTFITGGFKVPKDFILIGSGKDITVVKLMDNANNNYPHVRMIADNGWSKLFVIKDLTLDGNWKGQTVATVNGNFKVEPLVVQTIRGKADNIRVINFGANGAAYGNLGLEAFPLSLSTFSNGEPFEYYPAFVGSKEDQTYVEIVNCEVYNGFFLNNGYCTAIFTVTNQINQGDRQPIGKRTTRAASIRNNYVNIPDGIGFGAASSEMVWFEGNIAENCQCGFNFDTLIASRITIVGNQFLGCNHGINFTPSGSGVKIKIERNIFTIGKQWFNPILNAYETFYAINCQYLTESEANLNLLFGSDDKNAEFIKGIMGSGNVWTKSITNTQNGEVESLKVVIASLNDVIADQNTQIKNDDDKILVMNNSLSVINAQLTSSNQKILTLENAIKNHKNVITNTHADEDLWKSV